MAQNIILCDDHALLRNGIKSWIETHSPYKVTHEAGTWAECEKIIDFIASTTTAIKPQANETLAPEAQNGAIAIVDISFKAEYTTAANEGISQHSC